MAKTEVKKQGEVSIPTENSASIAPTAEMLQVADKIMSDISRKGVFGTNGDLKTVHKSEHFAFMKHFLKEEFGDQATNKLIQRAQDLFIQGVLAFLQRGGVVTFIRFGTFSAITRAERKTSLFGQPKTVERSTYLDFDPGKEAKSLVQDAVTTVPIGKLAKLMKGQGAPAAQPQAEADSNDSENIPV